MNKPSRRAVVRTGVWAVPVVAVAAAAPALATSGPPPVTITGLAGGCKLPGNPRGKSYAITLNITNSSSTPQAFSIDGVTVTGTPVGSACPNTFSVPSGNSQVTFYISDLQNSQQKDATVTISYESNGTPETFSFQINGFHPFGDATCPHDLTPPTTC
jgi:hypothetical protein